LEILENQQPGAGGEIQLTDAIDQLNKIQRVFSHEFKGKRYDVGDKLGMLEANIEFGLRHPDTKNALKAYLKNLAKTLD